MRNEEENRVLKDQLALLEKTIQSQNASLQRADQDRVALKSDLLRYDEQLQQSSSRMAQDTYMQSRRSRSKSPEPSTSDAKGKQPAEDLPDTELESKVLNELESTKRQLRMFEEQLQRRNQDTLYSPTAPAQYSSSAEAQYTSSREAQYTSSRQAQYSPSTQLNVPKSPFNVAGGSDVPPTRPMSQAGSEDPRAPLVQSPVSATPARSVASDRRSNYQRDDEKSVASTGMYDSDDSNTAGSKW